MSSSSRGPDKLFAYVVGPGNKAERRELVVGEIQDGQAVIQSGVKPGEKVVTSGYYRLEPGSLVDLQDDQKKEDRKQDKDRNKNQDVNQNAPRASASGSKKTVLEAE